MQVASKKGLSCRDRRSSTALHVVESLETCNYLIEARADVNAKDHLGWTPLHQAAGCGRAEVTSALVEAGADLKAKDKKGRLAIHEAKTLEVLKILIEARADIHAVDDQGHNVLDIARSWYWGGLRGDCFRNPETVAYLQDLMEVPLVLTITKSKQGISASKVSGEVVALVPFSKNLTAKDLKLRLKRSMGSGDTQLVRLITSEGHLFSGMSDSVVLHPDIDLNSLSALAVDVEAHG